MALFTLKLPRMQINIPITNPADGTPSKEEHVWWDKVAGTLEGTISTVVAALIRLGAVEITADNALQLSESAINPDGTIKDDKVLTQSMVPSAATAGDYAQLSAPVLLPDGVDTEILSVTFTKALPATTDPDGSSVTIDSVIRLESLDDLIGEFRMWRGAVGSTMIDSLPWYTQFNGSNSKLAVPFKFIDENAPAGPVTYTVSFERDGGASSVSAESGSIIDYLERKR